MRQMACVLVLVGLALTLAQERAPELGIYNTTTPMMSIWFCKKYKCVADTQEKSLLITQLTEHTKDAVQASSAQRTIDLYIYRDKYGRITGADVFMPPGTAGRIFNREEREYLTDLTRLLLGLEVEPMRFVNGCQVNVMGLKPLELGMYLMQKGKSNTRPPKDYVIVCNHVFWSSKPGPSGLTEDVVRFIIAEQMPDRW
ncbi:hypothetical protein Mterra_03564 [Calidithermus terrae]|uniref:Uncharacterized protein n=1 Tax=Calidithermus terrae TaxID=1408545 RepID=A0A399E565_9DEIN|nr:hypothetical protein [Calidithermus terrae]RIH79867.1 hypothetical protein Mterra_03564 [Calidithermus terrae]